MIAVLLKIMIPILNFIYLFYKLLPIQNKIVMISRQSNKINKDFSLIGKKLEKKYKVVYLCKTLDGGVNSKTIVRIKYGLHMFIQMYHLATSKVCVLDSYCPIVSILKHKKDLTIIQMWHSIGTMKKFGYGILDKKEGSHSKIAKILKMHKNYDVVYASSEAYKKHLSIGFNISEDKIKTLTLPRIDLLKDKKYKENITKKIYKKYPSLKDKKNIIYAPTFRKDETKFNKYLNELINNFNFDKYNLILKLHPLSKVKISNDKIIIDKSFSTFDMLFIADKLISDYSCIIYEAGILNIPIYFYNYDIDNYENVRGLAIDYKELPGYKEKTAKKLVKRFEESYDMNYLKKFINKYVKNTKDCTDKVVKDIDKYMESDRESMNINDKSKHNGIISFWKFMFCLMIVIYHANKFVINGEEILFSKGSIGVEFFFLVSGFLMAKGALKKESDNSKIGKETLNYIWKKIKVFFPYILVCHIIGLISLSVLDTMTAKDYIMSIFDLLLIRMAGFKLKVINGATWYISAMLISMLFLYPLIRKYKHNFIYIFCPLIVLLLGGWLSQTFTNFRYPDLWVGFAYKGFLRSIVELSMGSLIYVATEKVKDINFTKIGKTFITVIEVIGFLVPFYLSQFILKSSRYDFIVIIILSISIMLAFSEKTLEYKIFNNKLFYHLEKLSLPLYICHVVFRNAFVRVEKFMAYGYYQKLFMYLMVCIIFAEILMFVVEKLRKKGFYIEKIKKIFIN